MRTAGSAFQREEGIEERHDLSRALRRPGIRFSTSLAQNQPEGLLGDGLQFDSSAVKKGLVGTFRNLLYTPKITCPYGLLISPCLKSSSSLPLGAFRHLIRSLDIVQLNAQYKVQTLLH